jgi:hypothetical protein
MEYKYPVSISCDNTNAINISKNPIMHSNKKHILIKYHFLREQVAEKIAKLEYIATKDHIIDIFTNPFPKI